MVKIMKTTERPADTEPVTLPCCEKIEVMRAAEVIAYASIIIYIILCITVGFAQDVSILIGLLVCLIPTSVFLAGIHMKKPKLLIPALVVEVILTAFLMLSFFLINLDAAFQWGFTKPAIRGREHITPFQTGWIIFLIYLIFATCRLIVYGFTYKYVKERRVVTVQTAYI